MDQNELLNTPLDEIPPVEHIYPDKPFLTSGSWPRINFPANWNDVDKQRWVAQQLGLTDVPAFPPAAFYAGKQDDYTEAFSWHNYDPARHVLVHEDLFVHFMDEADKVRALTKGMRTVNKRRNREKIAARRLERKLAAARSGRETQRAKVALTEDDLAYWRRAYEDLYRVYSDTQRLFSRQARELRTAELQVASLQGALNDMTNTSSESESDTPTELVDTN